MKNIGIILVIIVLLGGGAWYYYNSTTTSDTTETQDTVMENEGDAMMEEGDTMEKNEDSMMDAGEVKSFTVDSFSFGYDTTEIRVKEGDKVRITLTNSNGFHDWVVDEFNAATKQIQQGETDTIEFVADKAGTYEYYCSVGKHREMGMVGTLIVE